MDQTLLKMAIVVGSLGLASQASFANPLDIGACLGSACTPTQVATQNNAPPQNLTYSGTLGTWTISVTGTVPSEPNLLSNTIDIQSGGAGTLELFVSSLNNNPSGVPAYLSAFTSNSVPSGWTVQEITYADNANAEFSTADELASITFSVQGTNSQTNTPSPALVAPFGLTEEYIITATGAGTTNDTIDLTAATPAPSTWTMFIASLLGLGVITYAGSKKKQHAPRLAMA
jgi:hypothetical protein